MTKKNRMIIFVGSLWIFNDFFVVSQML